MIKVHYVTVSPLAVEKQNLMHFVEEHCFGCALALHVAIYPFNKILYSPVE